MSALTHLDLIGLLNRECRAAGEAVAISTRQFQQQLSQQCEAAGSKSAWARKHGIPLSQVCEAISGARGVPESIILALGWVPVTRYVPVRRGA